MKETILSFSEITKSFAGARALGGVSFHVRGGQITGLIGENGAGKSTLMNILGGVLKADAGRMELAGQEHAPRSPAAATQQGIAFIHQELNLFANLSIAENIFITDFPARRVAGIPLIKRAQMRARAQELLGAVGLEVAADTLVEALTPGERQLVEIAKALRLDARVIIFDEPTTSLTARETAQLLALIERLRAEGKAIIYISHILSDVFRLADEIVVLRDGQVVGHLPTTELTPEQAIRLMVGRALNQLYPARHTTPSPAVALEVLSLTQPGVVKEINFALQRGEVLGLAGLMGAGRSELARIIFGLDPAAAGEVRLAGEPITHLTTRARIERGLAFLTDDRRAEGLLVEAGVTDNVALAALPSFARPGTGLIKQAALRLAVMDVAAAVKVKSAHLEKQPVKQLSGGNQQKVVLAKWLLRRPTVFVLDEPTRGIDVGAKAEIYQLINELAANGAGVLLISSEIEELLGMCDRILVMRLGELTASFARGEFDRERILRAAFQEPH